MPIKTIILIYILISFSCSSDILNEDSIELTLIKSHPLNIQEPSGLSLSDKPEELFLVSDDSKKIFRISLTGVVIEEINTTSTPDLDDLEGITFNPINNSIYVIQEGLRSIAKLNLSGDLIAISELDIPNNNTNKGPEGITFNNNNNHLYIINENDPSLLLEYDENFNKISTHELNFADDYSGIFYDKLENHLWIVSHESSSLTKCDIQGNKIETYNMESISQAEGIVIDFSANRIYAVSDEENMLYIYSFPE